MEKRGIRCAIDYLNSFYPVVLFKDELHKRAGCNVCVDSLSRKLRAAAAKGEIKALKFIKDDGREVVKYQGVKEIK